MLFSHNIHLSNITTKLTKLVHVFIYFDLIYQLLRPLKDNVSCNMCKQLTRAASAVQATAVRFVNSLHGLRS